MGLKEDLNLVGDQYSWLGSIFYFGKNTQPKTVRAIFSLLIWDQAISHGNIQPVDCYSVCLLENMPVLVLLSGVVF